MTPRPPCRSGSSDYWTASAKLGEAGSTPAHQLEHRDFGGRCHAFATDGGAWIFDIARGLVIILVGDLAVLSVQVHPFHHANAAAALQPDHLAATGLEMLMSIDAPPRASQRGWFAAISQRGRRYQRRLNSRPVLRCKRRPLRWPGEAFQHGPDRGVLKSGAIRMGQD